MPTLNLLHLRKKQTSSQNTQKKTLTSGVRRVQRFYPWTRDGGAEPRVDFLTEKSFARRSQGFNLEDDENSNKLDFY